MTPAGFPHSDIPGSQLGCQLPRAYRRLQRPSSALDAKASTMCPSQLATTNTTPHPTTHPTNKEGADPGHDTTPATTRHKRNSHNNHPPGPPPDQNVRNRTGSPVVMRRYKIHQPTYRTAIQNLYDVRVR